MVRNSAVQYLEGERELLVTRYDRRCTKRFLEPGLELSVGEEVQAQHRSEVGEGPFCLGEVMQPLQQQHGDQRCPNLDAQGVLAGAHEGLDLEVLLERLEEHLDLPALPVDLGDGAGTELRVVDSEDKKGQNDFRKKYFKIHRPLGGKIIALTERIISMIQKEEVGALARTYS